MKVEFCKSIDVEAEVSIDINDITSALTEHVEHAQKAVEFKGNSERGRSFAVQQFVTEVYQCLAATNDEMIEAIQGSGRKVIADALRKQANRFYEE